VPRFISSTAHVGGVTVCFRPIGGRDERQAKTLAVLPVRAAFPVFGGIHLTGLCGLEAAPGSFGWWAVQGRRMTAPGGWGWWCPFGRGVDDEVAVSHRVVVDGEFEEPVEDQAAAA
jgi:hypothetical protein